MTPQSAFGTVARHVLGLTQRQVSRLP